MFFYKSLMRGEIQNIPIVMIIDKEYKSIENKIKQDRDRNAFGDDLMKSFYSLFAGKLYKSGVRYILDAARKIWIKGHPLLSTIAEKKPNHSNWDISELFENEYFAVSKIPRWESIDPSQQLAIESLEKQWTKEGRTQLPAYFTEFGLMSALEVIKERDRKALNEEIENQVSSPSFSESKGIELLKEILGEFSPVISSFFKERRCQYSVGQTETLLGALRRDRGYRSIEVYLAADIFTSDLARALAVFLHEHSHIFGSDGSRGFTDALTELLESIVRHRDILDKYDSKWEQIRELVLSERANQTNNDLTTKDILLKMDRQELLQILEQMPQATLKKILSSQGIS